MGLKINISNGVDTLTVGPMCSIKDIDVGDFTEVIPFIADSDTGHLLFDVFDDDDILLVSVTVHRMVSLERLVEIIQGMR